MLFGLTVALLVVRAAAVTVGIIKMPQGGGEDSLLPMANPGGEKATQKYEDSPDPNYSSTADDAFHSSNSSTASERGNLQARSKQKNSYPLVQHAANSLPEKNVKVYGGVSTKSRGKRKERKGAGLFVWEVGRGLGKVVLLGGVWYVWLVWRDGE